MENDKLGRIRVTEIAKCNQCPPAKDHQAHTCGWTS